MKKNSKTKYISALILLVVLPITLLLILGIKMTHEESQRIENQFKNAAVIRLSDYKERVREILEEYSLQLIKIIDRENISQYSLIDLSQKTAIANQFFWLDNKGKILYPSTENTLTLKEKDFLVRTRKIFSDQLLIPHNKIEKNSIKNRENPSVFDSEEENKFNIDHGWKAYFWERGINLMFWHARSNGEIIGTELNRNRLISDVINNFPDIRKEEKTNQDTIVLLNSSNQLIMKNGLDIKTEQKPLIELSLDYPLNQWKLQYYSGSDHRESYVKNNLYFNLIIAVILISNLIIFSGWYVYREHREELAEASQKVSFVNQVSHELKTPLTNIRMHGELLEEEIELESSSKNRAGLIVSESRRLCRLVSNILSFSKASHNKLVVHYSNILADEIIENILEHFTPLFQRNKIEIHRDLKCQELISIDADIMEQILGNLLNNVEKYCPEGTRIYISSSIEYENLVIRFRDTGPGVPAGSEEYIFKAFNRLNDSITEGVSGTGIGLSISRDLARKHGGDLVIYWNNKNLKSIDNNFKNDSEQVLENGLGFVLTLRMKNEKKEV